MNSTETASAEQQARTTPALPTAIGTLEVVNQIGMKLSLNIVSIDDAFTKMRMYGSAGWISGEVPAGGYLLPYEMADTFDWSLIGGTEWTSPEDDQCILHRGFAYKRREYAAQTTGKKMGAAIKYSRGAKPTDSPNIREGDDDGIQYVTLCVFKGGAKTIRRFAKP